MAKKHHPDTNKDPNAQQKFMKIKEAFEILKSPGKRREFDVQGEVSEAEMVAPMDPQIRWRRNKYSSEKGYHDYNWDAMDESPPTQAEERRKKLRQINIIAFSSMLLLYLSALYITQPADNSAKVRRHPYLKKVKFEDRIPEPKDAASARAFNEARMPKRAYVIRDYVMDDYEEEEVKK